MCFNIDYKCRKLLEVFGEVHLAIKAQGFSWKFPFLVVKTSEVPVILGTDLFTMTGLVFDVQNLRYYFQFAPDVYITCSSLYTSNFALQAMTASGAY
jgi:hypothetical protein